jgi:hypothetical protein
MVNGFDLTEARINRLVSELLSDGVAVREVNTVLFSAALRRTFDEVGERTLRHLLQCSINLIDEGAYRDDYVPPEARMLDEEEALHRRVRLRVIDGGGAGEKSGR